MSTSQRVLRGLATTFLVVVGAAAMLIGILGGFWLYNELLSQVWNAIFHTTSPSGDMVGVSFFSALALAVIMFKLNEWLTKDRGRIMIWPSKR